MRGAGWIFAGAVAALVSGCTAADDTFGNPGDGYPESAARIADAADWSQAQTVVVELSEFGYSPKTLALHEGQPYALELTNTGLIAHRFVAHTFFRSIAVRGIVYAEGEAGYPALEAVFLRPQESKTLYFVPVTPGDYQLSCDQPLHTMFGMVGRILIE